jgi:two-component system, OmpR family, sensor histidine kinase BaeS
MHEGSRECATVWLEPRGVRRTVYASAPPAAAPLDARAAPCTFLPRLRATLRAVNLSRFDRLDVKLFIAIAGAIAMVTLAAYLVFTWSFERGFVQYLNRADEARLALMIERLAEGYAREGDWTWIATDRSRWIEMSRDALGLPRAPELGEAPSATPRRELPLTVDPRLLLFDADGTQLIGRPEAARVAVRKPIVARGATAGYLGYVPRLELIASIERVYLERQRLAFASVALAMLIAALILGAGLSYWLTRRTRALARATNALIRGDYQVRVDARGHDELAQLARDFNQLAATLSAAQRARQQWIADIAHELRTPVALLRAQIESLQDGVRALDQAAVSSLAADAARLARLVEDLHTLSLSDLGALTYYREPVDLAEIVTEVLDAQRRTLEDQGLALELAIEESACVLADGTRLAQVFGNLLQNSLRYTDAPGTIAVSMRRRAERVIVEWEDSAPGVPAGDLARLTERLYRVEGSRSRASGGSGLGLAIARAIVEAHGGTLSARASELGGLLIELDFPVFEATGRHG